MNIKSFFLVLFVTLSFALVSCDKDDGPKPPKNEEVKPGEDPDEVHCEYYVKYELKYSDLGKYMPKTININVRTEKGLKEMSVPHDWEGVFGPFHTLEQMELEVVTAHIGMSSHGYVNVRISICRGNQPYILKVDNTADYNSGIWYRNFYTSYTVTDEDLQ